jgi:hypothetical protein
MKVAVIMKKRADVLCILKTWWWWSCRWGGTTSLNCGQQRAYCSSSGWYMSMKNHSGMVLTGKNSRFVHKSSLAIISAKSSCSEAGRSEERYYEFCLTKYLFHTSKGSLTCRKIVRHDADNFTSHPKEVVLRICFALKIPMTSASLHLRTLDPIASTLTTRQQRTTRHMIHIIVHHTHIQIHAYAYRIHTHTHTHKKSK